jgi:hypothetical protein
MKREIKYLPDASKKPGQLPKPAIPKIVSRSTQHPWSRPAFYSYRMQSLLESLGRFESRHIPIRRHERQPAYDERT